VLVIVVSTVINLMLGLMYMSEFEKFNASSHPIVTITGDWNNLLDHGIQKAYTYIVRLNGSYYEAIAGATGKIVYGGPNNVGTVDGTDSSAVIQATITNAALYNSIRVLGTITLTDSLTFTSKNLEFVFDGFEMPSGTDKEVFVITGLSYSLQIIGKYIVYNNTGTVTPVIQMTCSGATIKIGQIWQHGDGPTVELSGGDCYYNNISINFIGDADIGVKIDGGTDVVAVNTFYIGVQSSPAHASTGFLISGDTVTSNTFSGSYEGNSVAGTICFDVTGAATSVNTILNYYAYDISGAGSYIVNNTDTTLYIIGGLIPVLPNYGTMSNTNGHVRYAGTIPAAGSTTIYENWGTASTAASDWVDVTHGLSTAPYVVLITPQTTGTGDFYVNTVGVTTFRVHFANVGTWDFYWYARSSRPV
jgi:hypothetical protein